LDAPDLIQDVRVRNRRGILLATMGILIISPDGLLLRLAGDAGLWEAAFIRTLAMGVGLSSFLLAWHRWALPTVLVRLGWGGMASILLLSLSNIAFVAAMAEGLPPEKIAQHIGSFSGIRRRFEHRGTWRGVDLVDDYAHHPSAISATLRTARSCFPGRRLIAIFEPHQVSRTARLFSEFTQALTLFDECLVLPVLPARENASSAECCRISGRLVRRISEAGGRAFLMANLDQVPGRLDHAARPGDVVITMGAGRTNQIHDEINRRLQRNSAA